MNQLTLAGGEADGSLWTLFYEFLCYLILGALALAGILRRRSWVLVATVGLWVVAAVITGDSGLDNRFNVFHNWVWMNLIKFAVIFFVGAVVYLYREVIPDSGWLAAGCAGLFIVSLWLPTEGGASAYNFTASGLLAPLVTYPMLWLGIHLPFERIGAHNDYSYGTYIYAYPVTVLLVIWHVQRWGYMPFLLATAAVTAIFAAGSWWVIEKRALSLKKIEVSALRRKGPPAVEPSST